MILMFSNSYLYECSLIIVRNIFMVIQYNILYICNISTSYDFNMFFNVLEFILYFSIAGLIAYYVVIALYLYGDLAIYCAAVPKSITQVVW